MSYVQLYVLYSDSLFQINHDILIQLALPVGVVSAHACRCDGRRSSVMCCSVSEVKNVICGKRVTLSAFDDTVVGLTG